MKFKVKLKRQITVHVDVLVDEKDVTTLEQATDSIEKRLEDPDWDPTAQCIEGSSWSEAFEAFHVEEVE